MSVDVKSVFIFVTFTLLRPALVATGLECNGGQFSSLYCTRSCAQVYRVPERSCPLGGICCKKGKMNPYRPFRLDLQKDLGLPQEDNFFDEALFSSQPIVTRINRKLDDPPYYPNSLITNSFKNIEKLFKKTKPGKKSAKYCKEYAKLTVDYLKVQPLLPKVMPLTITMDNCAPKFTPLIVGGRNASDWEYPHMAALGYDRNGDIDYLCGGTLVSQNFVLTAAHCIETKWGPPVLVHLGSSELYSEFSSLMKVKDVIPHPDYEPPSTYFDIALIKIEKGLKFSAFIRPACLPPPDTKAHNSGSKTIATGWGKLGFGRESAMNLHQVALKIINNKECEQYYDPETSSPILSDGITSDLICAVGYEDPRHDTCQGDSGGPLQAVLPGTDCMYQIVGITSFGKTCGVGIPAVYTKVASFVQWIERIVWP